jgi:hypothetical protein
MSSKITTEVRFTVTLYLQELRSLPRRVAERREYERWLDDQSKRAENERLTKFAGQFN